MSESVLSTTLPTATNAKGAALKSRKYKKSAFGGKKSPAAAGTKTAINGEPVSSSNSVGVAFPQPRVAGEDRYPG